LIARLLGDIRIQARIAALFVITAVVLNHVVVATTEIIAILFHVLGVGDRFPS